MGKLLERYRSYLRLVADAQVEHGLAMRADASDLVQETFLEAHRDLLRFRGETEAELVAWLRQILNRNLVDQIRRHGAKRRDWRREESIENAVARSSAAVHEALVQELTTPSEQAVRHERAVLLAEALDRLKPHYREVIVLRHVLQLSFEEVAQRMNRTAGAVRMLWTRALESLREMLHDSQ